MEIRNPHQSSSMASAQCCLLIHLTVLGVTFLTSNVYFVQREGFHNTMGEHLSSKAVRCHDEVRSGAAFHLDLEFVYRV